MADLRHINFRPICADDPRMAEEAIAERDVCVDVCERSGSEDYVSNPQSDPSKGRAAAATGVPASRNMATSPLATPAPGPTPDLAVGSIEE